MYVFIFVNWKILLVSKKFKFRLAAVLRYREILKDTQEAKVLQAIASCKEVENEIDNLDAKQHATYQAMIDNLSQGFSLIDKVNQDSFNEAIINSKSKEKTRLAKRQRALDFERLKYTNYARQHLIVEKLEDKAKALHHQALIQEENKLLDDLVNSKHRVKD